MKGVGFLWDFFCQWDAFSPLTRSLLKNSSDAKDSEGLEIYGAWKNFLDRFCKTRAAPLGGKINSYRWKTFKTVCFSSFIFVMGRCGRIYVARDLHRIFFRQCKRWSILFKTNSKYWTRHLHFVNIGKFIMGHHKHHTLINWEIFYRNGFVNGQNCRIWGNENPQNDATVCETFSLFQTKFLVPATSQKGDIDWPPISYDLTSPDFFLWL